MLSHRLLKKWFVFPVVLFLVPFLYIAEQDTANVNRLFREYKNLRYNNPDSARLFNHINFLNNHCIAGNYLHNVITIGKILHVYGS